MMRPRSSASNVRSLLGACVRESGERRAESGAEQANLKAAF